MCQTRCLSDGSNQYVPGVLLDVSIDQNGDLDRESFIVKVVGGKQQVITTVPPLGKK